MNDQEESPTLRIVLSSAYKRDLKRLSKALRDISPLEDVVRKLARFESLDVRHRDHALKGRMTGLRVCHIRPDWLLVYRKELDTLILVLIRTGTHRDTLGME